MASNFWVGLALLHTLFTLEHNAICDRLRREFPGWSDDHLYDKARLINAALMAKIHTTEWTPAIIAHPTSRYALRATWPGIVGERLGRRLGHLGSGDLLSGTGSKTNHHGFPYSLTEEFVAVYRMHPDPGRVLVPLGGRGRGTWGADISRAGRATRTRAARGDRRRERALLVRDRPSRSDLAAQLPALPPAPGAPDGTRLDLAATDILRIRERGVPRYNQFRRLFRLRPAKSFAELTDNPDEAERIRRAYDGEIERVDLMVGLYAEPKPKGFGFSDRISRLHPDGRAGG